MAEPGASNQVLLLNTASILLGRGILQSPPDAPNMQIQLDDIAPDELAQTELLQAVPQDPARPPCLGRIILQRKNRIVLEIVRVLDDGTRQNLRVPVVFESFVYPASGGRAVIKSDNLSCSGVAFYTARRFEVGELFEIVIPITSEPLLVHGEIVRLKPSAGPFSLYAAKFVDLIYDEEVKLREAVFSAQIRQKASLLSERRA